jgi:kumamolisin
MLRSERKPLRGSGRALAPGAHGTGERVPDEAIEITVRLRRKLAPQLPFPATLLNAEEIGAMRLKERKYVGREEYAALCGASPADLEMVRAFAERFHLVEAGSSAGGRSLRFRGSVGQMNEAFGTMLETYRYPYGTYRGRLGELYVPNEVAPIIEGVFGLDNRRQSRPFATPAVPPNMGNPSLLEILRRYSFPQEFTGRNECIAILEFGGGIAPNDLTTFFQQLGTSTPNILFQSVNSFNNPNVDAPADSEVALDLEVAGGLAPNATLVAYFATNDEKGWVDGLTAAVHDNINKPTIVSISWGAIESWWEEDKIATITQLFEDAAYLGITTCAASGDSGCDSDANAQVRVAFPASSSLVLACGGSAIGPDRSEIVWNEGFDNATGGGISDRVSRPNWQAPTGGAAASSLPPRINANFDGRGLPDVAGLASRLYTIYVHGAYVNAVGGTSAVAPLWAALVARLNEGLQRQGVNRLGYFTPLLYRSAALQATFTDIKDGNNSPNGTGGYAATSGWDSCTGWGSPNANLLLRTLFN